ncbi:unnamed protein product [Schistosoma mattheei]|uniref:Uncharacterized protein n=1 Tax=Schistosoma mattheei TaxID=31246 RepID=A0A3P8H2M0_9TREM|nr:unnamed protein product [Schistosoma mattheei]
MKSFGSKKSTSRRVTKPTKRLPILPSSVTGIPPNPYFLFISMIS